MYGRQRPQPSNTNHPNPFLAAMPKEKSNQSTRRNAGGTETVANVLERDSQMLFERDDQSCGLSLLPYPPFYLIRYRLKMRVDTEKETKAVNSTGVPPLPIPNREVKPRRADGTAKVGE